MSDIKTTVLEIDSGGAITNIKEFKQHIEDLKGKLLGLEKGTTEYNTVAKELQKSQQKLNEVMDVAKGKGEAVEGSYDNLVATMRELKKAWRATGDEVERKQLGEKILGINNKLKELDASTGNFQRNVGNYANSFTDAFNKLSTSIGGAAIPSVKGLNTAFKTLMANPIVAFLAAVVGVIQILVKSIKGSEEQTNRMKTATAGLKVVMDSIKNAISKVSDAVVTLTEKISNLIKNGLEKLSGIFKRFGWEKWGNSLDNFTKKVEEYTEQEKKAVDISSKRRKISEEIARTENKIADLRAKISDKTKYAEQERLRFIEEWEKAEKHKAKLAVQLAQEEYNIIKIQNARSESNTKDLDAESAAYVNLIHAQGQYSQSLRTINQQKTQILKETLKEEKEQAKETKEQVKKDIKELVTITKEAIKEISNEFTSKKITLDFEFDKANIESKVKEIGGLKGLFKDFSAFPDIFSTTDIDSSLKRVLDYNNEVLRLTTEKNNAIIEENQRLLSSLPEGEESNQARLEAQSAIAQARMDIENATTENILRNLEAQDEAEEKISERRNQRLQTYSDGLLGISNILDTVSQYQQKQISEEYKDGKISEEVAKKRFEDTKKMQIASAVINMAAGVVSAIAQAQQLGPIAGPIAAAVNAAAVITAGAVQIATISKTKFGDGKPNTSTPNLQAISNDYTPEYTQNVTADNELTELTNAINSKPLYVSVTDIDSVQNTVKTRDKEATY